MTKITQTMLFATGIVVVGGGATWLALGGLDSLRGGGEKDPRSNGRQGQTEEPPRTAPEPPTTGLRGTGEPGERSTDSEAAGGGVKPGLRAPSGEDLSSRTAVLAKLHELLAEEDPRWDWVADLVAVLQGPLDATVRKALEKALVEGNAAGAIQVYQRVNDGSVVPDLLRLLDDPASDPHDLANILFALSTIPGGDAGDVVKGIEARMSGDPKEYAPYLRAIARKGGMEAVRALVEAVSRAPDLAAMPQELWQELDLTKDPAAAEYLAYTLRNSARSPEVLRRIVEMAGRPGGGPVVEVLAGLTDVGQPDAVRRQAFESLGKIGTPEAVGKLLAVAQAGADYGSVAAHALSGITSAPPEARAKLVETLGKTEDDFLRQNVIRALGNLHENAAVPALTDLAANGSDLSRRAAAEALGRMGAAATPALPVLGKAFASGDDGMRCVVAVALGEMRTPEAKTLLRQLQVSDATPKVKQTVAAALRSFDRPRD